jgi:hypothetical protein
MGTLIKGTSIGLCKDRFTGYCLHYVVAFVAITTILLHIQQIRILISNVELHRLQFHNSYRNIL